MSELIYINFINIDSKYFFNYQNSSVIISLNDNGYNSFSNEYYIKYDNITNTIEKKYYIEIFNLNKENLITDNFILNVKLFTYKYGYYKNESTKSLILYNLDNYYQVIYLGLPNLIKSANIQLDYNFAKIETEYIQPEQTYNSKQSFVLLNNYQGILNYLQNTIYLNGLIYKIIINSINTINDDGTIINNLDLFKISNNVELSLDTRIYIYNNVKEFSYVLYLSTYNFSEYKLFPENYSTIIVMINYIEENLPEIKYKSIFTLNLQTFNLPKSNSQENDEYYNVLFFYNYINPNYKVKNITIFSYDYDKYFINTTKIPEYYNIDETIPNINLYNEIIGNDTELIVPIIPNINLNYLLINFNLINLLDMIRYNCENNNFINFTKSNIVSISTLINYLANFNIKPCNLYYILNSKIDYINNINNINIIGSNYNQTSKYLTYNYNYLYNESEKYGIKKYTGKGYIDFNNNIVNSIRCKIIFLFEYGENYTFYGKLFLDNYNIQIYHKNYELNIGTELEQIENKKKLVNLLLYLASKSLGIKIIFYNNLNSEPSIMSTFNYFLNVNPYYLFNEINLSRKLNNYDIYLGIDYVNNNYNTQYLKLNINIKTNYYILFLYSDKNTILDNYDELVFNYSQYIFKIFKNKEICGNIYENKHLFFISFNNLEQINIFLKYLNTGLFSINQNNYSQLSNYFNFSKSEIFCNYYMINNYWVLDSLPEPQVPNGNPNTLVKNKIYFSINNLKINQIYLYGNLFINTIS